MKRKLNEMNTTSDVDVFPGELEKPDTKYREKSCFTITKKELREFAKNGVIPERVAKYKKVTKENMYMRYGAHLTFRVPECKE